MPKTYTRLTEDERYQIYEGVTEKRSHREIALLVNKHNTTVSREVDRNTGLHGYRPKQAQQKAYQRNQNKPRYIKLTADVQQLISENIMHEWSPDQIKGRLKVKGLPWSVRRQSMALSNKIKIQAATCTSTSVIGSPIKGVRVHLRLGAKLLGAYQ
jgi:IS30 family transposase